MAIFRCYLRKKQVLIPTVARADAGFYLDVEPVAVLDINDAEMLKRSIVADLDRGNKDIPTPAAEEPGSVILEALGLKNWQAFEKESVMYTLHSDKGGESSLYVTGRGANGLWAHNKDFEFRFPKGTSNEDIARSIIERLTWQSQIEWPEKPPARLAPPSN